MSPDYAAVKHVLAAPRIAHRTTPYIALDDFDFEGLARESEMMSGGEALLIRIAQALWRAEHTAGLWEIARRLDHANFERVLEAFRIARGDAWAARTLIPQPL